MDHANNIARESTCATDPISQLTSALKTLHVIWATRTARIELDALGAEEGLSDASRDAATRKIFDRFAASALKAVKP